MFNCRWKPNCSVGFARNEPFITRSSLLGHYSRPGSGYYYGTRAFRIAITSK